MDFNIVAVIVIADILGSLPFAYITARLKKKEVVQ
jgi:glycerol-3-phosphate acyltransferase PlsY